MRANGGEAMYLAPLAKRSPLEERTYCSYVIGMPTS